MKRILFMLAGLLFMFASCSDGGSDSPETPKPQPQPEANASITFDSDITSSGLVFDEQGGEKSVSFTTNKDWTLSIAATTRGTSWCTASEESGSKGDVTIKFTVTENTEIEDRSVAVTIKAGTASQTFKIAQKGVDALLVTTSTFEVPQEGGTIDVEVKANIDYQLEIAETAKSWITEANSRAMTTQTHSFAIAPNEDGEKREGEIYIKSGDKLETVKVYQAGSAVLLLSQNEYTVSDAGETITVDVKSNVEYGVQMPEVDWIIDEASARGMSSHTLQYTILPNETYDNRSAEIIFYDKNSDLKETLTITQVQKNAIVISQKEYNVKAEGETIEVKLSANVDFEITMPDVDWISQVESRGLVEHSLYFTVAENTSEEGRSAEIVFTNTESQLSEKISITQQGVFFLQLTKDEYIVSDADEIIEVEVKSNVEYGIKMPEVDWITQDVSGRAVSAETLKFIVEANETYDSRSAEIVFYDKNSDLTDTLKVVQAQNNAIILSQKEYEVKAEGEIIEVKLSANVDFEVTMPEVDWITQVESRSLTEHMLYFNIAENADYEKRSAEIVVVNKEYQLSDTITIHQETSLKAGYADGIVTVTTAGTMKSLLSSDYLSITSLKIVGYINGDDIYYLRKMLGGSDFSEANWGSLTTLDLSEATIVEGGGYYYLDSSSKEYFTSDNVIGDCMFYHCSNLQNIVLPKNAVKIGKNAFSANTLSSITLGNDLTSIDEYAFSTCNLNSIVIPDNVTKMGKCVFYGCTLTSITIGSGITSIDNYTFGGCSALTSIVIPDNVTWIGRSAFFGCDDLKSVTIGNGVTSIGDGAFSECSSLTSVTIGNSVTRMGERTFFKCSALTSMVIPDNVTFVPQEAFYGCI